MVKDPDRRRRRRRLRLMLVAAVGVAWYVRSRAVGEAPVEQVSWPPLKRTVDEDAPEPGAVQPLLTSAATAADPTEPAPGGARSRPDGAPPGPEYTIKGNAGSKLFHSPTSPYYGRTKAEVWFRTPDEARAAGFTEWTPRKRATR